MKRVWKISDQAAQNIGFFRHRCPAKSSTKALTSPLSNLLNNDDTNNRNPSPTQWFTRKNCAPSAHFGSPASDLCILFADKLIHAEKRDKEDIVRKISQLRDELVRGVDTEEFERVLENWVSFFRIFSDGAALVELVAQLESSPLLAIKVIDWRRRQADDSWPMTGEEYSKGIKVAGRIRNLDLAVEIFMEAANNRIKTSITYNALMGAYMCNGLYDKCQSLFRDFKREVYCSPTVVTYNILISVFGRSMLVHHMEATFQELQSLNIAPNLGTYNNLIAGYVTAWMWDHMENTYNAMKIGSVKPNLSTHLLMLRGYSHSGDLEKMEEIYSLVECHVNHKEIPLIRAMICAYCKSSATEKVKRIEELMSLIPEDEYRSWLNVLLIRVYAQENMMDKMDLLIDEAFKRNTIVTTVRVMRCILTSYFHSNAVDKLANFVKRAEDAGWRMCRSLFHCMMKMYAAEQRLDEMERVLDDMEKYNFGCSKKTFVILYKAYSEWGQMHKVHRVVGLMCKHGYGVPS